jgi:large subunit ribosomal protein L3
MSIGIFGKKLGMTQIFDSVGNLTPVTLIKAEECQISQIKTISTDGYNALQVGYVNAKLENLTKPQAGHLKKCGDKGFKYFGEFRTEDVNGFELGQMLTLETFEIGDTVSITGKSIGRGFAGNQKRHNFSRGPMTHGSKNHRLPGSIGAGSTPARVYPGKKMAGQLGNQTVTLTKSKVLFKNLDEGVLVIKGSVPGKVGSRLKIQLKK